MIYLEMEVVVEALDRLAANLTAEVTKASQDDPDSEIGDGEEDDYFEVFIKDANENRLCRSVAAHPNRDPIPTAREVPPSIPEPFALRSNYPNPFLEETIIPFEVPKTAHVTLRVYDLLGRKVVFEGLLSVGRHEVKWWPSGLPSGFYLVRLEAAGTVKNRPLVFIK